MPINGDNNFQLSAYRVFPCHVQWLLVVKVYKKLTISIVMIFIIRAFCSSFFFLVRRHDDDEVDDISCLHAVLS